MIRVAVVDDHPVVREGITGILTGDPDLVVTSQSASAEEALGLLTRVEPDVVVIDLRLPGMSGTQACTVIRERHPKVQVIVLTSFATEGMMLEAFAVGARGFVVKESEPAVLRQAIRAVMRGDTYVDPSIAAKLIALATRGRRVKGPHGLTLQEMRVVERLPRGLTNREIGHELGISDETVKTHLRHAMRKLGARDRAECAAIAMKRGLA